MVTAKKYSKKISVEEAQSPDYWDHVAMARGGGPRISLLHPGGPTLGVQAEFSLRCCVHISQLRCSLEALVAHRDVTVFLALVGRCHHSQVLDYFLRVLCFPSSRLTSERQEYDDSTSQAGPSWSSLPLPEWEN